jgi:hypothetical protein
MGCDPRLEDRSFWRKIDLSFAHVFIAMEKKLLRKKGIHQERLVL